MVTEKFSNAMKLMHPQGLTPCPVAVDETLALGVGLVAFKVCLLAAVGSMVVDRRAPFGSMLGLTLLAV